MARSESQRKNRAKRWKKIQSEFKTLMEERTSSGAKPSSASVIEMMADDWGLSVHTIEGILRKELQHD